MTSQFLNSVTTRLQAAQFELGRKHEKSMEASVESLGLALRLLAQLTEQDSATALQVSPTSLHMRIVLLIANTACPRIFEPWRSEYSLPSSSPFTPPYLYHWI